MVVRNSLLSPYLTLLGIETKVRWRANERQCGSYLTLLGIETINPAVHKTSGGISQLTLPYWELKPSEGSTIWADFWHLPYPIGNWNSRTWLWGEFLADLPYPIGNWNFQVPSRMFLTGKLTLPYWELKLVIMSTSTRWNRLTLPYWELKLLHRFSQSFWLLTLPYWGFYHTKKQLQRWTEAAFLSDEQRGIIHWWKPYRFWRGETIRPYV